MKYLIYGGGTIGTAYAWLLSSKHEVDILVKKEQIEAMSKESQLWVKDLRKQESGYHQRQVFVNYITEVTAKYDGILVAVNRCQLESVLPELDKLRENTGYFVFMQNNWNLAQEVEAYFKEHEYIVAFPSSVGGGHEHEKYEIILFDEATRLGGTCAKGIVDLQLALNDVDIKTEIDEHIFDWLKVHYLQQSITAGAVLEKGSFLAFANDYHAVKKMVKAFREGIAVCKSCGVPTNKIFPANLFRLPVFLIAHIMKNMFLQQNTIEMVNNHMKKGLSEWVSGYLEVLEEGEQRNVAMPVWKSYYECVSSWVEANQ